MTLRDPEPTSWPPPRPMQPPSRLPGWLTLASVLASLLAPLLALLLGWQAGGSAHPRPLTLSQTLPLLPELRPLADNPPAAQGQSVTSDNTESVPRHLPERREEQLPPPAPSRPPDLTVLGRMNLDPG